jgi:hypothetical protein
VVARQQHQEKKMNYIEQRERATEKNITVVHRRRRRRKDSSIGIKIGPV